MTRKKPKPFFREYQGYEIYVERDVSMSGIDLLFYSVFRIRDGYELMSGFSYSDERPAVFAKHLKGSIDEAIKSGGRRVCSDAKRPSRCAAQSDRRKDGSRTTNRPRSN